MCLSISRERSSFVAVAVLVSLHFQHGTMHACDCRIASEGEATCEREAQRQPIAHSARVLNRNDRSRGQGGPRVSTGGCSRSINTLCCTTPSGFCSRTQKVESTLPKRADFFRPKGPKPYSGSQLTATTQCLSSSQDVGLVPVCSRGARER